MEVMDVDQKKVNNVMFKRIGVDVPMLSKSEGFESDQLPARALALSNRFGYTFFAHSRGFSVAKTADLLEVAEKLSANADESKTAQEAGTATVSVANIRSLALCSDEITLCVCAGGDVMFFELATLVNESDKRPFEVRKVDPHDEIYAKDFFWSPSKSEAYLILTSQGKLLLGHIGSAPECKVDKGVVAASWSADGQHIAYVADSRQLNITSSNFADTLQHELPNRLSDEDNDSDDLHVDAIRWVRPDSIVIGYLRVNSEGEEDEYPLFVLNSRNGNLAQEDSNLVGLVFYQLFPSIDPFVVPSGSGPCMLLDYVKPWELVVAASRKSIDDHIVLMSWFPEDGTDVLYSLELVNDLWTPRIELQESSEDNAILGLAIDRTTVQIKLSDPMDESGDTTLPPCPVLVCLTLEGKLSFFSVARLGEKSPVPDLVTPPSTVPNAKRSIPRPSSQLTIKQDATAASAPFRFPAVKAEPQKAEPPKVEPPKVEPPKVEPPKVEPPKVEPPKEVQPKVEQVKEEPPKEVVPKLEPSEEETPKIERQPKEEPPEDVLLSPEPTAETRVPRPGDDSKEAIGQSVITSKIKPAVKDERDSLFERLTSASSSFPQGDDPSESSRLGLQRFPEDAKKSSVPVSPSVMTLGDLTGTVNVASKKDFFEGLFRPFDDASKGGLASVKSAPPPVKWGSQLPSGSSSLSVTPTAPLQSVQSGPVPSAIGHPSSEGNSFPGRPATNVPVSFGQGSQGKGFQAGPAANPPVPFGQGSSQGKGLQGATAANSSVSLGLGSQGKGFQGGVPANATASFGAGSQGKDSQGPPAATPAISSTSGSQGKGFKGGTTAASAVSFGPGSQGKGFQGASAANATVSFGPGAQGKGLGGPAATSVLSFGSQGSQGKGFQVGPPANSTLPFGASVKSPLGPTAPKLTSNQRGNERFTHSSRILQDHQQAGRAAGMTDMEASFNVELEDVREMAEKVDQLMSFIEGKWVGEANDPAVAFTRQSLEELEERIHHLSTECKEFRGQLNQTVEEIEDLRDEEMRVDAWMIYTRSLLDQKNDSRYQELWNSQKLHPELETRRKRLVKADQELKQHIAELEGHLHILELKHFQQGHTRRRINNPVQSPGRFLSVQNLYNTVNAQMAVADELSNSLAQQMEALNIKWSPQTPKSTASKILKSVGADVDDFGYAQSPLPRTRLSYSPMPKRTSVNGLSAFPAQEKEHILQETTRRRRDSMDAGWVHRETPKTTIKRVVRTMPSQNVSPGDSTQSKFKQRLQQQPSSDFPIREKLHFSQNAFATQSAFTGPRSGAQSFPDPSFEESSSFPSFRPTGMFASTPQWPSAQPEAQQIRPGAGFSSGDLRGSSSSSSSAYQGSAGQGISTSSKESMFKWANATATSKPITSAPPSTVAQTPFARQFPPQESSDGIASTGVMANSRALPAAKPASFGNSGGPGAFNFASASFSKSTTAGASDQPNAALLGTAKSNPFLKRGAAAVGHRLGSLSSGANESDGAGDQPSKGTEMLRPSYSAFSLSLQAEPSTVPVSKVPLSTSVMAGPDSVSQTSKTAIVTGTSKGSGSASTGISLSFESAQQQSKRAEREPQKGEEEPKPLPPGAKAAAPFAHFPSFSKVETTKAPTSTENTLAHRKDSDSNEKQQAVARVQSDLANLAKPLEKQHQPGPPGLFSRDTPVRPFNLNSTAQASPPSIASGASSPSTLSPTTPPRQQTPDLKSIFASPNVSAPPDTSASTVNAAAESPLSSLGSKVRQAESETPVKVAAPATALTNLGSQMNDAEPETPAKTGAAAAATTTPSIMEQSSSSVAKLDVGTPADKSMGGEIADSINPAAPATSSVLSAPTVSTGLFSSSSSTGSAFSTSTPSILNPSSGSVFSTSTPSVPNQASGAAAFSAPTPPSGPSQSSESLFASSSVVPAFPASPSQSMPSSPFGQPSAFGQSTFGQSSPFGQSAQQPQIQQPFAFPGSSASSAVSNAAPTPLPSVESNEEDMEEEASTGTGNTALGSFGGFGGLGLGNSASDASAQKANPFGVTGFGNSQPFQLTPPTAGQLFRPATFSLPSAQSSPQSAGGSTFGSGFGSTGFSQNNLFSEQGKGFGSPPPPQSAGGGFGQPAQLGSGQQALGSALGAFGQTRQVGFGAPFGNNNSGMGGAASGGGFANSSPGGGFANAVTDGGFAKAATGGGFAGAGMGGGFAGSAPGGGFAGAASGGGFGGAAAGAGGGFAGLAGGGGGFQGFAGNQNQGGPPGFGSGVPAAQTSLFTQMRK